MSRPTLQYASIDQFELTREVAGYDWLAGSVGKCYVNSGDLLNPSKVCMQTMTGEKVCADSSQVAFLDGASQILGVAPTKVCGWKKN
jgi:hypothetical protein